MAVEGAAGTSPLQPNSSVFVNCPFDETYEPLMNAIVFAVVCCGFTPRVAKESGDVAVSRLDRICTSLHGSRYSIHDLSRCTGEGDHNLARFNMPLELGMAMGRRFASHEDEGPDHDWLVLVPDDHAYVKFISDLAGFDPGKHDGSQGAVVQTVMAWLWTRPDDAVTAMDPSQVLEALPRFEAAKERLEISWGKKAPWDLVIAEARYAI
jgi:hypothetical protein